MNGADPVTVDARGMRCPWPALRLARAMRTATAARLISDDPRAETEAAALAAQHGWQFAVEHGAPLSTMIVSRQA
jgi:tRNA 2-thiouridine synthesizing protein A